jgi:hypothetical protein
MDTDIFITKIDDYYFRILNKNNNKDRLIININSSKNKDFSTFNEFSVYLSKSDLGCFRLGLKQNYDQKTYYKGEIDYIQQTFIHVKLQEFIYKCLDLEYLQYTDKQFCNINKSLNEVEIKKITDHIDDNKRAIKKEPFISYDKYKCGEDKKLFIDSGDLIIKLNEFSRQLETLYNCDIQDHKFIFKRTVDDQFDNYTIKFNKINLKLKIKNDNYQDNIVLYYCTAYITKFQKEQVQTQYINLPIFLTTDDKITEFGTFNTYILAGNYICKAFEYTNQCTLDIAFCSLQYRKENDLDKYYFDDYYLIGNRYDNIFPLNIIKKNNSQTVPNTEYFSSLIKIHFDKLKLLYI